MSWCHADVYLVVIFLDEAAERQAKALVWSDAPVHGIDGPWRLVFVDLFSFTVQRHGSIPRSDR